MWMLWCSHARLNMALTGSMLEKAPFTKSKPAGEFIHALAATTKIPEAKPETPTASPVNQCTHGFIRFHP